MKTLGGREEVWWTWTCSLTTNWRLLLIKIWTPMIFICRFSRTLRGCWAIYSWQCSWGVVLILDWWFLCIWRYNWYLQIDEVVLVFCWGIPWERRWGKELLVWGWRRFLSLRSWLLGRKRFLCRSVRWFCLSYADYKGDGLIKIDEWMWR